VEESKPYEFFLKIAINMQTNTIKWKIMTLEKFRKKKHQIWRSYKEEILVTNFNSGSKRENELYMCSSSHSI